MALSSSSFLDVDNGLNDDDTDDKDEHTTTAAGARPVSCEAGTTLWALIVDPTSASTIPHSSYNVATTGGGGGRRVTNNGGGTGVEAECGQFDDAASSSSF